MSDGDTARETVGPVSHRDPEAWCSRTGTLQGRAAEAWCSERGHYRPERPNPGVPGRGHYRTERPRPGVPNGDITGPNGEPWCSRAGTLQDKTAEAWCSRTGTLQAQIPSTASDGLASLALDPSLEHSTDNVVLFWQPRPIFAVVAFVVYRRRRVIFLRGAVYDGRIGQAF